MINILFNIFDSILGVLPASPFQNILNIVLDSEILAFLNWFIPFDFILGILETWLTAVVAFYAYQFTKKYANKILSIFIK